MHAYCSPINLLFPTTQEIYLFELDMHRFIRALGLILGYPSFIHVKDGFYFCEPTQK